MVLNIPNWNKTKFEKLIKSLQRKGLKFSCEDLGETLETIDDVDYICTKYSISDELVYANEGWEFVGTIEHKEAGNIIRKVVNVNIPKYYETAPCECEHCHTIRKRNDTYLVRNKESNEFKQVGKSCLKDYTGLNPAICAWSLDLTAELAKLELDPEEVILGGYNTYGAYRGYDANRIKKIAYNEIQKNGYKKTTIENNYGKMVPSTKDTVIDLYYTKNPSGCSDGEIQEVDAWVDQLDTEHNDYFRNASIAYKEKYYEPRDLALVISLISCYFRDMAKKAEMAAKEKARKASANKSQMVDYLGAVGDKVEFEVASDFILFVNEPYAYGASVSYTHKIVDTEGHIILWSTSADTSDHKEFNVGTKIKATVKAHKDFRGELQTVVTRGKVI